MRARWSSVATPARAHLSRRRARRDACPLRRAICARHRSAPYRARTTGKTEAGVKYVKRNGLADLDFESSRRSSAKPHRTRFSTAATALIFINQEGVSFSVGWESKNPVA
jgi:transposase